MIIQVPAFRTLLSAATVWFALAIVPVEVWFPYLPLHALHGQYPVIWNVPRFFPFLYLPRLFAVTASLFFSSSLFYFLSLTWSAMLESTLSVASVSADTIEICVTSVVSVS